MELDDLTTYLSQVSSRYSGDSKTSVLIRQSLAKIKSDAVKDNDQKTAKLIWCYETILNIQENYLKAFENIKSAKYYEGWCILEQIEIELLFLERHFEISGNEDCFKLEFIKIHTERFQSLYPYNAFGSPGMLQLEKKCSTCNQIISIRKYCGHTPGEIYDGVMCTRQVTKVRLLEFSLVTEPAQKYSVLFLSDSKDEGQSDHYNYSLVKYVINGLQSPFDSWFTELTKKRHPHSRYKNVGRNDDCPCESGKKYKHCCQNEIGVLRPHILVYFSITPPMGYPEVEYAD